MLYMIARTCSNCTLKWKQIMSQHKVSQPYGLRSQKVVYSSFLEQMIILTWMKPFKLTFQNCNWFFLVTIQGKTKGCSWVNRQNVFFWVFQKCSLRAHLPKRSVNFTLISNKELIKFGDVAGTYIRQPSMCEHHPRAKTLPSGHVQCD